MNPKAPKNNSAVCAHLIYPDIDAALDFYEKAFGLKATGKMPGPDGKSVHAEVNFGGCTIMLGKPMPGCEAVQKVEGTPPFSLYLYVDDVDRAFEQAIAAGATEKSKPKDQFYGDRSAGIVDPFGHQWGLGTRIKDLSFEEMQANMKAMMAGAK